VVAHFHYVLVGGSIMTLMAGTYYWFPKMAGKMLSEKLGNWVFWMIYIGLNVTFFPMHFMGIQGMARRIFRYRPEFAELNMLSSIGYVFMLVGGIFLLYDLVRTVFFKKDEDLSADPWGVNDVQQTLDWEVSSPPPAYNFEKIPEIK
jgi:cytochrome c oxidase subunit 1